MQKLIQVQAGYRAGSSLGLAASITHTVLPAVNAFNLRRVNKNREARLRALGPGDEVPTGTVSFGQLRVLIQVLKATYRLLMIGISAFASLGEYCQYIRLSDAPVAI